MLVLLLTSMLSITFYPLFTWVYARWLHSYILILVAQILCGTKIKSSFHTTLALKAFIDNILNSDILFAFSKVPFKDSMKILATELKWKRKKALLLRLYKLRWKRSILQAQLWAARVTAVSSSTATSPGELTQCSRPWQECLIKTGWIARF